MSDAESTAGDGSGTVMDRRALLRAGGLVAGIAGMAGYAAVQAPAAAAAAGGPVVMGATNNAETTSTVLTTHTDFPTLILANSYSGPPLRLEQQAGVDLETAGSGDLMNVGGDLRFVHSVTSAGSSVYTSLSASQLIPVIPFRAVDTRTVAGRVRIAGAAANLDSAGRLIGGRTIEIYLQDEVFLGTAVFANLTVTQPVSSGYLTLWPGGTRPGTSTLNYSAGPALSNFCVSGMRGDTVRLYARSTTHVVLDVVAFAAGSPYDVRRAPRLAADASNLAGPAPKPPAWRARRDG